MTTPAPILVGQIGQLFWMRVDGKGSFQNSVQVKRCFQTMIEKGERHFVIDLERCPIMDSTFLGTLTGAALNLRESGNGEVSVLNANSRNQQLLTSLGLDHILDVDHDGSKFCNERKQVCNELNTCADGMSPCPKEEQAAQVLAAHEALTQANAENAVRFRDVIEFLEQELRLNPAASPAR
ncbi:MAG: STAS domain-containing protein [Verrucomicrobia bacterium]|nr:STAS domain-containing protein [Verrucomicrobiota bacterium]